MKLEDRRAAGVLVLATLALAFDYYHRRLGLLPPPWDFFEWHVTAVFFLGAVPLLVATLGFGFSLRDLGFTRGEPARWLPASTGLLALMLVVVAVISRVPAFQAYYPTFGYARHHPEALVVSIIAFGVYLFAYEFFFRGLLIGGLRETFGPLAIVIQAVPFTLVHFGKPELEAMSALFVGLALGWIAYHGRSFLPAFLIHWIWYSALEVLVVYW
jgi:membrane protease YdiL (CAAX protease family)